jgi:hypothetical protein
MKKLIFLSLHFLSVYGFAQTAYNKFQWKEKPVLHSINKQNQDAAAVFIADDRIIEYGFEKNELFIYRTMHRIIHINNDKGIESFNKIYLPFNEGVEMLDVKARTILPGGTIIELDKNNIKDLKDEDGEYKIFALEGLTKGCEIEFYFTLKKYASFFGREMIAQGVPVMKSHFELIAPEHLVFETKSYNKLPASKDTVYGGKRYLVVEDADIKEAEEEQYSMFQANLKRVEYKLSYNKARNERERLFTWNELAKKAYDIYSTVSDKEYKKIKDLLGDVNLKPNAGAAEKIMAIENYLKKNFITRDDIPSEDADDMIKVIKNKIASEKAIIKLYAGLYKAADINYQIVLCGDRINFEVDRTFENWNNTDNFLLYFPATKKFLAPTQIEYRYPWIPPTWTSTNGLYCINTTIGNFSTAVAEVKNIPMESYDYSFLNMDMNVKLDKNDILLIDVKQSYGGYAAPNYRAPFVFLPEGEQDKVLKEMIKFGTNSENILSHSFENKEIDQTEPYKPFVINASVRSTNLIERAGDKIIIKIGEVIGEQTQMYNAKERTTDISLAFPHALVRTIQLTIPDGYIVKNLSDLNFNERYKEKDKTTLGFVCSYEQKGNILNIKVQEEYHNTNYPLQQFETFKKVINAAADFNKVVLILDKAG